MRKRQIIAGENLYQVTYKMPQAGDNEYVRLVVAKDMGEAELVEPTVIEIRVIETDISLSVPDLPSDN